MTGTRQIAQVHYLLYTVQSVATLLVISAAGMWPAQACVGHGSRARRAPSSDFMKAFGRPWSERSSK